MNLEKGAAGFYVCGSTAEALMLPVKTRCEILDTALEEAGGACNVIAHVGSLSQADMLELARHADRAGADVLSAIPPFYYGFSFGEIRSYYLALADAVSKPVLLYYFPQNSGVRFTPEDFAAILGDSRFLGVKFTDGNMYLLERILRLCGRAIAFNGYDEMFLSGLIAGASGGIGSTYNFMAEKFASMLRLYKSGEPEKARAVQREANNIISVLSRVGVMRGEKAILEMMGVEMGDCLAPFRRITQEEREELRRVCRENGVLV